MNRWSKHHRGQGLPLPGLHLQQRLRHRNDVKLGVLISRTITESRNSRDAATGEEYAQNFQSYSNTLGGHFSSEEEKEETMLSLQRNATGNAVLALRAQRPVLNSSWKNILDNKQLRWSSKDIESEKSGRERVVVLGSGWAGYTLARDLDKSKYQVVVVSPRSYFVFTPLLASTSVGTLEFRCAVEPVRSRRTNVDFFQGWADQVDFHNKTLSVEEAVENPKQGLALTEDRYAGKEDAKEGERNISKKKGKMFDMSWDKLIIAVGCYSQTFNTPGVKEHAYFLKDVGDARKIRTRLLACFETAALPTTCEEMKKVLLNFAVVGGGPTGIEWSAELHDIIREDMAKLYPDLMQYYRITVYDVAPKVLAMFDEKLGKYAMNHFKREGIQIKTSHHVQELRRGLPKHLLETGNIKDDHLSYTIKLQEEGEIGVGMVVWSTGLMMNPFISNACKHPYELPCENAITEKDTNPQNWVVERNPRSGAITTNDRLQPTLHPEGQDKEAGRAYLKDVFALGDCATIEGTALPATAQVANQKARWLAKRLNQRDIDQKGFTYKDLGVMAYIGNWNAIMQSPGAEVSGRFAWFLWRGAYLTKSVSWRNRILIPIYWFINWLFGRDISRF
ncbi:pyridine nucleotide-disulfide oxidoreductase-domain-containing protein [Delphinella strobiligena]|nr:pyridine nucleotide-disulfide oxidoreductase-domain-containing protein [Delphinella strobiligena]